MYLKEPSIEKGKTVQVCDLDDIESGLAESDIRVSGKSLSVKAVLRFMIGETYVNTREKIDVNFEHMERRLQANTCSYQLAFPVCERYTDDDSFSVNLR